MSENPPYPPSQPEQPNQPGQPGQPGPPMQPGQPGPPMQPGYYPPPGQYNVPPVAPNSSKATTSLVLGICSLVVCGLFLGIPAMIVGRQAKREIRESQGRLGGAGLATAGFVTGLIGTIWSVLGVILLVLLFAFGAAWFDENCTTTTDADGTSSIDCSNT